MTQHLKDYQREKLYTWERSNVPQGRWIPFDQLTAYVANVWEAEGREHPPLVEALRKGCKRKLADGCRSKLRFQSEGAHESTVLHEIAHALTCNVDDTGDWHGPHFVGVYIRLLSRHMGQAIFALWYSADRIGLDFVKKL
jgi:hypothetical protein